MADISTGHFSSQHFISSDYKINPDVVKGLLRGKEKMVIN